MVESRVKEEPDQSNHSEASETRCSRPCLQILRRVTAILEYSNCCMNSLALLPLELLSLKFVTSEAVILLIGLFYIPEGEKVCV